MPARVRVAARGGVKRQGPRRAARSLDDPATSAATAAHHTADVPSARSAVVAVSAAAAPLPLRRPRVALRAACATSAL